jgi:hypothetical protein
MIRNLLFIFCLFMSLPVLAQTAIDRGQSVPEDGVFYTNTEAARLIAEKRASKQRHELELKSQKEELLVVCDGEKKVKDLYLDMEKQKSKLLSDLKDKQIENLYKALEKESEDYSMWWFAGGATVGTVASVVIFFAATQVSKIPSLTGN